MTSSGANDESNQQMLRSMIFSFRVSELQMLLGYAGRNKNGKKEDLQSRALDLVKIRSTPMQAKIRQIYKASQLENMNQGGPGAGQQPHLGGYLPSHYMNMYTAAALSLQQQQQQQSRNPYSTGSATGYPQLAPSAYGNSGYPLINPSVQTPAAATSAGHHLHQVPRNPDVKFVRLPFYDVQAELVKPISMVATSNSRLQEANCSFLLTPQQATDIASNRDTSTGPQADFMYQVQLRFCQLTPDNRDKSKELNDEFPPSISVQVNGKLAPLPNPIPTNKPGVEPKRPPRPVNITPLCKLSPILPNNITVKWASDMGKSWVVGIWLVVKLNSNDLLERLKKKGTRNPEFTRGLIVDKLSDDDEVATESLKVSVACPLGKMRMKVPCRPSTCSHLQCFDAGLFLQMNERKPTWNCPVCDSKAVYDTLLIDGYFQEVLSSKSLVPDENEIILDSDGTWKPVPKDDEKTKPPSSLPPSGSQTTKTNATNAKDDDVECIDLSGDEGESNGTALPPLPPGAPPPPPPYPPTVNQPPPPPGLPEEIECIDLD